MQYDIIMYVNRIFSRINNIVLDVCDNNAFYNIRQNTRLVGEKMSKERPYEFVPTYAIAILISEYERLINAGFFKLQKDLDKMKEEMNIRFNLPLEEDRQISIEEYIRSRKKDE